MGAVPIDRGWAWVVLAAACTQNLMVMMFLRSQGIIYNQLLSTYNASASTTGLMIMFTNFIVFFGAPIFTGAADMFTVRIAIMCAGLLLLVAGILASVADNIYGVVIPFGIIGGCGFGILLSNTPVIVARYFDKYRPLANGLLFSCAGFGSMIGPIVVMHTINEFETPQVFLVFGAFLFQVAVTGSLYRPLTYWSHVSPRPHIRPTTTNNDIAPGFNQKSSPRGSDASSHSEETLDGKVSYVTRRQLIESNESPPPNFMHTLSTQSSWESFHKQVLKGFLKSNFLSRGKTQTTFRRSDSMRSDSSQVANVYMSAQNLATVSICDLPAEMGQEWNSIESMVVKHEHKWSGRRLWHAICYVKTVDNQEVPLYNLKILSEPSVFLFAVACTLMTSIFQLGGLLTPAHNKFDLGMTDGQVETLLLALGTSETVGRLFMAFVSNLKVLKTRRIELGACMMLTAGVSTIFAAIFANSYYTQLAYLIVCPFCTGAYIALHVTILVDLVGLSKLSSAIGVVMVMEGLIATSSPMIISGLKDVTGSYRGGYFYLASCLCISGVCLLCIPRLIKKPTKTSADTEGNNDKIAEGGQLMSTIEEGEDGEHNSVSH